jgi:hypothetical protein
LDNAPKGLSEDTVRFISAKEDEPAWMLERRLDAYRRWLTVREPHWARVDYGPSDYQDLYYYSAPRRNVLQSLDEVDPEILRTYEKLGIPLREREILAGVERPEGSLRVAVDAVFDSVSVATTFQQELAKAGVLFMPISEALQKHPQLVKKYRGTLVPISYNFFATLNSAVFSGGSSVQEIFERAPRQSPRLVTKLRMPPCPSASPGYQFCAVEYLVRIPCLTSKPRTPRRCSRTRRAVEDLRGHAVLLPTARPATTIGGTNQLITSFLLLRA